MKIIRLCIWCSLVLLVAAGRAEVTAQPPSQPSPLQPIKTDNPRDTMHSFMVAMDRYAEVRLQADEKATLWLNDAVRCFDLSTLPVVGRMETAHLSAIYLKEVIDRVIRIDYEKIPTDPQLLRWRLKDTEIAIMRQDGGPRKGEFLFTADTVERAPDFFAKVKDLPLLPGTLGGGWATPWQEAWIPDSLTGAWLGVETWQWILMGALIFVGLLMRQFAHGLAYLAKKVTARTPSPLDDELIAALTGPVTHLATTGVWFASLHLLGITGQAYLVLTFLIKGAFFINLAYLAYKLAGFIAVQVETAIRANRQDINESLFKLMRQTLKILALVFCLLLGAQNMGMDVASLVAGLGIGGLAFALAAKDTLANLFGFIMIMIDRPLRIGDWVIVKGCEGTVEDIGFRCTRIRTFYNSLISIPNSELVMANVDNMGMREFRRIYETLGITYDTPPDKIEAFCEGIKNIILANPFSRKDYLQVYFHRFANCSLDIMVYFFVKCPDWPTELEQRQRIFLEIARLAKSLEISFAFPTQTLHIESTPEHPLAEKSPLEKVQLAEKARAFGEGGALARPTGAGIHTPRHRELA